MFVICLRVSFASFPVMELKTIHRSRYSFTWIIHQQQHRQSLLLFIHVRHLIESLETDPVHFETCQPASLCGIAGVPRVECSPCGFKHVSPGAARHQHLRHRGEEIFTLSTNQSLWRQTTQFWGQACSADGPWWARCPACRTARSMIQIFSL